MNNELRKFGVLLSIIFILFGVYILKEYYFSKPLALFGLIILVLSSTKFVIILRPFFKIWMFVATKIGLVVSTIILFLIYYLLIVPFGIVGKKNSKFLNVKTSNQKSFWENIDEETNFYKQY